MALDYDSAVRIISNVFGFKDEDSMVGEAWQMVQARITELAAENQRLREALEIIAGYRPCVDDTMSDVTVAREALRSRP